MSLNVVCLTFCDPEDALRLMDERLNDPLVPLLPLPSMLSTFSRPPPSLSSLLLCPRLCSCFLMSSFSYFLRMTSVSSSLLMSHLLCLLSLFLSPLVVSSLSLQSRPFACGTVKRSVFCVVGSDRRRPCVIRISGQGTGGAL